VDITIETAPIATHDMELAARMERRVTLNKGRPVELKGEGRRGQILPSTPELGITDGCTTDRVQFSNPSPH
jgi:hypothetical protein